MIEQEDPLERLKRKKAAATQAPPDDPLERLKARKSEGPGVLSRAGAKLGQMGSAIVNDPLGALKNILTAPGTDLVNAFAPTVNEAAELNADPMWRARNIARYGRDIEAKGITPQEKLTGAVGTAVNLASLGTAGPLLRAAAARGIPKAVANTAAGGVYGAASGAASDLEDPLAGALAGGAAGSLAVGVPSAAAAAVKATKIPALISNVAPRPNVPAGGGGSALGNVASRAGIASHQEQALTSLLDDIRRSGLTTDEFIARSQANPLLPLYDLGPSMQTKLGSPKAKNFPQGDPLVVRAETVAGVPSTGSRQMADFVNTRAEQRPGDVKRAVEGGLGAKRENVVDLENAAVKARDVQASKDYNPIRDIVVDDPEVLALFDEPEFRTLHKAVQDAARLRQVESVPPLKQSSALVDAAGEAYPDVMNPQTLGTLDKMKQFADAIVSRKIESPGISSSQASSMSARLKDIRARLDAAHPEYGKARSNYATASDELDALVGGNDFWKTRGDDLEVAWRDLSDKAKQEYRKTALAAIEEKLGSGLDPSKLLNEVNARKLRIIAESPSAYENFERSVRQSVQGQANDAMILGNSRTAARLAGQADLTEGPGAVQTLMRAGAGDLRGVVGSLLQSETGRRLRGLNETRVDALAPYLTASGPDLERRLLELQAIERALAGLSTRRGQRAALAAGQAGGQVGGRP